MGWHRSGIVPSRAGPYRLQAMPPGGVESEHRAVGTSREPVGRRADREGGEKHAKNSGETACVGLRGRCVGAGSRCDGLTAGCVGRVTGCVGGVSEGGLACGPCEVVRESAGSCGPVRIGAGSCGQGVDWLAWRGLAGWAWHGGLGEAVRNAAGRCGSLQIAANRSGSLRAWVGGGRDRSGRPLSRCESVRNAAGQCRAERGLAG